MSLPNNVAGFTLKQRRFYTCTTPTDANKVKKLARAIRDAFIKGERKRMVWILTGTHGTAKGQLVRERHFYWSEDKTLETQMFKAVDVFGFSQWGKDGTFKIAKNRWNRYLGGMGICILAWCYSEQSRTGWMKEHHLPV